MSEITRGRSSLVDIWKMYETKATNSPRASPNPIFDVDSAAEVNTGNRYTKMVVIAIKNRDTNKIRPVCDDLLSMVLVCLSTAFAMDLLGSSL